MRNGKILFLSVFHHAPSKMSYKKVSERCTKDSFLNNICR